MATLTVWLSQCRAGSAAARVALSVAWAPLAVAMMPSCTRASSDGAARGSDGGSADARGALDSSSDVVRAHDSQGGDDAEKPTESHDSSSKDVSADASPCTTTITYGQAWVHGANHPSAYDVASGQVTWDGSCTTEGENSYATLSNGWKPYFTGQGGCILALDYAASCGEVSACSTRVTYGAAWIQPAGHSSPYDDIAGRVFSDGLCNGAGSDSYATLSNGWQPHFSGDDACGLSFRYVACGGLYANPVIPVDCPDPGVLADQGTYYLSCTSGDDPDAFPIYASSDLVHWTAVGHIFPSGYWPSWAAQDFWAPEIHLIGGKYVAYFAARDTDGMLSVGAATSTSPTGPFTDIGQPLVHDPSMGEIDPTEITVGGTPYVLWKDDGNAIGKPTPIHAQAAASDGLSLTGSPVTLITNDQAWEGAVTEGPWMVEHGGTYFLFYSGNSYDTASYAVGVASAPSPLGPFTKASGPILASNGAWAGPGHCSVIDTLEGDPYMVYHSWQASSVGGGPGRVVLTDALSWSGSFPSVPLAPSSTTRPMP